MNIKIKGSLVKLVALKDEKGTTTKKINIYNPEFFIEADDGELLVPDIKENYVFTKYGRIYAMKFFEKDGEKVLSMKPSMYFKAFDRGGELDVEPENYIYYNCYLLGNTFDYTNKTTRVEETSSSVNTMIYELKEEKKFDVDKLINDIEDIFGD